MSEADVVLESTDPFNYKNLFLAVVRAAGGRVTIYNEDYVNPPQVQVLNFPEDGSSITFEVLAETND